MVSDRSQGTWQERCGAFLFTMVGGYLDAYSYIAHRGVFANAQTGNVVLLAVNIVQADWSKALGHLIPILTFSAGVLTVTSLSHRWEKQTTRLRLWSATGEAGVLSTILALQTTLPDSFVVPMISFAAAVQITSFGSVGRFSFNSAMTTGNLRSAVLALGLMLAGQQRSENREKFLYMGSICLCFLLGALLGGSTTRYYPAYSLIAPLCGIVAAAALSRVPGDSAASLRSEQLTPVDRKRASG